MVRVLALLALLALLLPAAPASAAPGLPCDLFPPSSPWHRRVDGLPVHPRSADYVASIGASLRLRVGFGTTSSYGMPVNVANNATPLRQLRISPYASRSNPNPYAIPTNHRKEGPEGGDDHLIVVRADTCTLEEHYEFHPVRAASGAVIGYSSQSSARWDLRSNALRPEGWTSADAAGLPILPGLVRYAEVAAGRIDHPIRVSVARSQAAHVFPARHHAGVADARLPPMGLRLRLKAGYDIARFTGQARVVAVALKRYGLIVADNGPSWVMSGEPSARWVDADLARLGTIPGSAFEAVETGPLIRTMAR
jgi:hypothetical protein